MTSDCNQKTNLISVLKKPPQIHTLAESCTRNLQRSGTSNNRSPHQALTKSKCGTIKQDNTRLARHKEKKRVFSELKSSCREILLYAYNRYDLKYIKEKIPIRQYGFQILTAITPHNYEFHRSSKEKSEQRKILTGLIIISPRKTAYVARFFFSSVAHSSLFLGRKPSRIC